jgi:hypothetical protein
VSEELTTSRYEAVPRKARATGNPLFLFKKKPACRPLAQFMLTTRLSHFVLARRDLAQQLVNV